jgi:hypothetical protein
MRDNNQPVTTEAEEDNVQISYQSMASENVEDLVCTVVRSQVHVLVKML